MTDSINTGDIDGKGIAIGEGARAEVNIHNYPAAPETPTFPIHHIAHPENPNFTGREKILQQVATTLAAGQTTVVTQTIAGLGGVGKTQLALAYSYAHLNSYDLIYWLSADSEAALGEELMTLARRLKLVSPTTADQQAAVQAVLHWLGQTKQRWLLVYDNADQIEPAQLAPMLPHAGSGHVLITSRNPNYGGLGQVLELGLFSLDEAVGFLLQRSGAAAQRGRAEWQEAADLAKRLGRLPLALEHAAAYVASKGSSYAKYHQLFRERQNELWQRAKKPERYHATITTTWELAFDEVKQTPGAMDLLNLCCFLDPDGIPLALIQQIAAVEAQHAVTLQEIVADELALDDALGALRRYSLVQRAAGDLNMHRLVQAVARMQMGAELTRAWVEVAVNLLTAAYSYDKHDMSTWAASGDLLPHLTTATDLAETHGCETSNAAFLNNEAGYYIRSRGSYAASRPFYERALTIYEKTLGPDHPDTAQSLNNLGALLDRMGDLAAARPYYERALAIFEKALGPNHPHTALSLNNLGFLLQAMGDLPAARPFYQRALDIFEKSLGTEHPTTEIVRDNLAALDAKLGR